MFNRRYEILTAQLQAQREVQEQAERQRLQALHDFEVLKFPLPSEVVKSGLATLKKDTDEVPVASKADFDFYRAREKRLSSFRTHPGKVGWYLAAGTPEQYNKTFSYWDGKRWSCGAISMPEGCGPWRYRHIEIFWVLLRPEWDDDGKLRGMW